jgi:hypothetical protein
MVVVILAEGHNGGILRASSDSVNPYWIKVFKVSSGNGFLWVAHKVSPALLFLSRADNDQLVHA